MIAQRIGLLLLLGLSLPAAAVHHGDPAPACALQEHAAGKVTLVDFWATWCPPCRHAMPFYEGLYQELGEQGFIVIAVNVDEDRDTANRYLQSHPVSYPIVFDPAGQCSEQYALNGMPASYLIDRQGYVRHIHTGFRDSDRAPLREQLQRLLETE